MSSANYAPPSVNVNVISNPRIISGATASRYPAIVGIGPSSITVIAEPVIYQGDGIVHSLKVAPLPGAGVTAFSRWGVTALANPVADVVGQNLYSTPTTTTTSGTFTYATGSASKPTPGSPVYVSYTYTPDPAVQLAPELFFDADLVRNKYGAENNSTGSLTTAANIAFENGAPGVIVCQVSGSTAVAANYGAALEVLLKRNDIEDIIPVFPSGTLSNVRSSTLPYLISHCLTAANFGKERGFIYGASSPYLCSGSVDTVAFLASAASAITFENASFVVPSVIQRTDQNSNTFYVDGDMGGAALAGYRASLAKRSTPMTGAVLVGLTIQDGKWNEAEMNQLAAANCVVLESKMGIVTVRDAITTDPTSADTQEMSIIASKRLVKRTLREGLTRQFLGRGRVITPSTPSEVSNATIGLLKGLVQDEEIFGYGAKNDPSTGETAVSAVQNTLNPRQIDVTCSIKYLYPLKYLNVSVSLYI